MSLPYSSANAAARRDQRQDASLHVVVTQQAPLLESLPTDLQK